jgi:COP9 signalosome complex subunit 5
METARATWDLENNIADLPAGDDDEMFRYDEASQKAVQQQRPWVRNPHYFKHVRVSALALIKMTMHCRSGGNLEVMGMLQGKTVGDTFVVLDAFALPVEGTETRVNAQAEAYEYMVDFVQASKDVGRKEHVVGWYHSHPGYGCWMSGIDCSTQMLNQQYTEPFLAIVIDPVRTCAAGKVEIGAFRTYPQGYNPPEEPQGKHQTIPMNKIEDFGVHARSYYSLDVSFFKSSLDARTLDVLWNKYWVNTLSSSPLRTNAGFVSEQLADLAEKMNRAESQAAQAGRMGGLLISGASNLPRAKKTEASNLRRVALDAAKCTVEQAKGTATHILKDAIFNRGGTTEASG